MNLWNTVFKSINPHIEELLRQNQTTFDPQVVGQYVQQLCHARVPQLRIAAQRDPAQAGHRVQLRKAVAQRVHPVFTVAMNFLVLHRTFMEV